MPRAFLIDTDTASDDAVAIIMALRAPDVRVVAITTVAATLTSSNPPATHLHRRTLWSRCPGVCGRGKPLLRRYETRPGFMPRWSRGSRISTVASDPRKVACRGRNHRSDRSQSGLVIVTLAHSPISLSHWRRSRRLFQSRSLRRHGRRSCCEGNVTPAAEYKSGLI